jgi:hypothetical protein
VFANIIIVIAGYLNILYIPFYSHFINRIESISLGSLLATITLGFLFVNADSNSHTLWISVLVILVNSAMAAFLAGIFFKRMRDVLRRITKKLPAWMRFADDMDDVKFTKNTRAASRAPRESKAVTNVELASFKETSS